MSLEREPSSEPLHISAGKYSFFHSKGLGVGVGTLVSDSSGIDSIV